MLREYWGARKFFISSLVLSMLYVLGSGVINLVFCVNSRASLYAGASLQLTTGRVGCFGLCVLINP